ncbi:MAG: T9SS type A sorting domain-containing protein [Ignavibacteria bacterium]|jgi:hypothetical protein|nr:T9SS type A sorting domain-containing protein [Ignavibacteria bacterium]
MKRIFSLAVIFTLLSAAGVYSQDLRPFDTQKDAVENYIKAKGELYFRFNSVSKDEINNLSRIISIDKVLPKVIYYEVFAYASPEEFREFAKRDINFELLKHPGDGDNFKTSDNIDEILAWDTYPTYPAYVSMMNSFASNYPNLCKIVNIGATVQNRQLLYAVISDSVNFRKPKPRFMYVSTIHGDETTGYVLMLRLIDTLLSGYGNNPVITNLVKNCEIWINPNANPDGTYYGGDNTVNNARRFNYNGKDLNRNFPDPVGGPNPTGTWQPETIAMMNIMTQYNFTLSMNFHGGAEVFNYPWDHKAPLHPDDAWFIKSGRRYVDTVHAVSPSTYLDDLLGYPNIPGVVNGFAWYIVTGGRQDFMTYFKGGREITLEISSTKLLPPAQLPTLWNYNHKSFLNFIKETLYGIRGIVTDSVTNQPLKSKIYVSGQNDTTWIFSDSVCGDYHRLIAAGTYSLVFTAPNYYTKTISGVRAAYDSTTILNVKLRSSITSVSNNPELIRGFRLYQNYPNPFNPETRIKFDVKEKSHVSLTVYNAAGQEIQTLISSNLERGTYETNWHAGSLPSGVYFCSIKAGLYKNVIKMLYIK